MPGNSRWIPQEVRGAEVVDLLAALNTGHEGGCGTVHANSAVDVVSRLETLTLAAGLPRDAAHSQIGAALHVVVHLVRRPDGSRRVGEIGVVEVGEDHLVRVLLALSLDRDDTMREGPGAPVLLELLRERGPV
ncbi:CpaF/VirB11 family protein [Nocardioidaceae bacterium]|nr:CpaF/VirB11 family protein [Nocardioidaceae bacterium]